MLSRIDLAELIYNGENTFVEFKSDATSIEDFAKELVAFANARGGTVLIGVDDDGTVIGLRRVDNQAADRRTYRRLEEWVMQCGRDKIRPSLIPSFEIVRDYEPDRDIGVVRVSQGLDVHARFHNNHLTYYVRAGSTSREADREELQRLFQRRGGIRAELIPIAAANYESFDVRRLREYFSDLRGQPYPDVEVEAIRRLVLTDFMSEGEAGDPVATLAGLVLFGARPDRYIQGCAIEAVAFASPEPSTDVIESLTIRGPSTRLGPVAAMREPGLVETGVDFVTRHTSRWGVAAAVARDDERPLPVVAVREAIVNAVSHRDYTMPARASLVRVFPNRLEIHSPGRLPNGITPDAMRLGTRASRNQLIVDTMRDYGYLERLALGIPTMIRLMREFNATEPNLEERNETFVVTLQRAR